MCIPDPSEMAAFDTRPICDKCGEPCETTTIERTEIYPEIRAGYANSERVSVEVSYCCHADFEYPENYDHIGEY